jgi:hypothetical protein
MRQSDRIAQVRLSFRHRLTAGVALGALLSTLLAPTIASRPAHAVVDPGTVAAVAQTAATALSFMNQGPDLTLEVVQQNHRLLVHVHKRLDGIEAAMGSLLEAMAELPGVTRKIVQEELDVRSSNELINSLRTLTTHLEDDGRITGCPREEAANSAPECLDERQLVHAGLDRVREGFEGLTDRDPVVNAVALSLAPYYELAYKEALGATATQLEEVRQEHRAVLQRILDPENPKGLPTVIAYYEQYRSAIAGDEVARRSHENGMQLPNVLAALGIDELPRLDKTVLWYKMLVLVPNPRRAYGRGPLYSDKRKECRWRRVAAVDFGHGVSGLAVSPIAPELVNLLPSKL